MDDGFVADDAAWSEARHQRRVLVWSNIGSGLVTGLVIVCVCVFANDTGWMQFGPHAGLSVAGVAINTWARYALACLLVVTLRIVETLINEFSIPIVAFNIYNPDKRHVVGFSRAEMQLWGNSLFLCGALRQMFTVVIAVSQVDLALAQVLAGECTTFVTIRVLLRRKQFWPRPILRDATSE